MTRSISRVMSLNDHLSRPAVTNRFKQPTRKRDGQPHCFLFGLASSGVYRACFVTKTAVSSYLAFPPLPVTWRYISVALAWESPPPDVIRHPALWSPDFPHLQPFVSAAAITCPAQTMPNHFTTFFEFVKCFFANRYTIITVHGTPIRKTARSVRRC